MDFMMICVILLWGWLVCHMSIKNAHRIDMRYHYLDTNKGCYKQKIKDAVEKISEKYVK